MFSLLQVKFNPSKQLAYVIGGLVLVAAWCIWLSGFHWLIATGLAAGLCFTSVNWLRRYVFLNDAKSVQALRWSADNQTLAVCLTNQQWYRIVKIEERMVMPGCIALRLLSDAEQFGYLNVWIMQDSVADADMFRRLKVLSRFAKVRDTRIPAA